MANGFEYTDEITVTADGSGEGDASGLVDAGYRHGWVTSVHVELSSGDATNFGINLHSRKNGANFYTTEDNAYKMHTVASAARTTYHDGDANFAFLAEQAGTSTAGRRTAFTVNVGFTGATAASTVKYKVRVTGIGMG